MIDIVLAYINTNHPDFISMDDVFTERANHHSRNEMYQQIGHQADEEIIQKQQVPNKHQGQKQNNPKTHPLNNQNNANKCYVYTIII